MSDLDAALPRAAVLRATLRAATDRLATELTMPSNEAPVWNEFEWRTAMAVSVMHGITGLLAGRLRWQGPPDWQAFLDEQLEQSRRRESRARELLARLDASARHAGLPMLAMKGSALLALGLYMPGERPMSDVDLLARPEDMTAADSLIQANGYSLCIARARHVVYEPPNWGRDRAFGEHERNPTKIELHPAVQEPLPLREIDITASLLPANALPGLNPYASEAALMRHLLLHAAGNFCQRSVRLIHLHDIAVLGARLNAEAWREVLAPASDGRPAWWAVAPLTLARQLFPDQLPSDALGAGWTLAVEACPRTLRQRMARCGLVESSLSQLDLPMLPGIEWSQSAAEAVIHAWRRLYLPREERAARRQMMVTEHWQSTSAWLRRPRWLKVLSVLSGAPPRAQTMYNLHHALAYRPSSSA